MAIRARSSDPEHSRKQRRLIWFLLALATMVAVIGVAVSVANSATTAQISRNASVLHWANAAGGSSALSRAATNQAVLFALGGESGFADAAAVETAVAEANRSLSVFESWALAIPREVRDTVPDLQAQMIAFAETSGTVLDRLGDADLQGAVAIRDGALARDYQAVSSSIETSVAAITDEISSNERRAQNVALLTRLLVTLLIPAAAVTIYWLIARRQMHRSAVEAEARVVAQREMIAGVSHELRTPLTAIYGFSELLANREVDDTASISHMVRVINSEAADLTRMVDDLLTAARIDMDELPFVPIEFTPVEEIESVIAPYRRSGRGIGVDCPPLSIVADDTRFRQIIRNLVSNAVKYGGEYVLISGSWDDDHATFSVTDDGEGIDEERQVRLFTPFLNHGHDAILSGSVGLGLAVSQVMAAGMGGSLRYDDSDGLTTFALTLPTGPLGGHPPIDATGIESVPDDPSTVAEASTVST
jgi:signal transduction histidine kinase